MIVNPKTKFLFMSLIKNIDKAIDEIYYEIRERDVR